MILPLPRLYIVTDDEVIGRREFLERAESVLEAGGRSAAIQFRARHLPTVQYWELARTLGHLAAAFGSNLWINERVDVAQALRADGVQLGSGSLPTAVARRLLGRSCPIGRSVHSADEVGPATEAGADLAVLGNIYSTESHPGRPPLGLAELKRAVSSGRPIVAIGGITCTRCREVMEAGAWGVAVLSGVWNAGDPAAEVEQFLAVVARAGRSTTFESRQG